MSNSAFVADFGFKQENTRISAEIDKGEENTLLESYLDILEDQFSFDGKYKKEQEDGLEGYFSTYYADIRDDGFTVYFRMDWDRRRLQEGAESTADRETETTSNTDASGEEVVNENETGEENSDCGDFCEEEEVEDVKGFGDLSQVILILDVSEFLEFWVTDDRIGIKA